MNSFQGTNWRNYLLFPLIISTTILYALLLKNWLLLGVTFYYVIQMVYQKQSLLLYISFGMTCLFLIRLPFSHYELPPTQTSLRIQIAIYPDTIKINDTFVTGEGKTDFGRLTFQYPAKNQAELASWQKRGTRNKAMQVVGSFKEREGSRNLHGFNRKDYEFSRNQLGTFIIEKVTSEKPLSHFSKGRQIRAQAIDWVEEKFPPDLARYIKALLLGYRDQSFQEIREAYSSSGILHLFSISGMHLAIFLGWFFYFFRRSQLVMEEFIWPFLAIMFFLLILFGQGISIWRATIMYLVNFLFKNKQIHLSAYDRFAIGLFLLLLIEPKSFLQISGILSILLSFMILSCASIQKNSWRLSIDVGLLAIPILMYLFYEVSLVGGLLTAVIAPIFSLFLLPGFVILVGLTLLKLPITWLITLFQMFIALLENSLQFSRYFVFITGKRSFFFVFLLLIFSLYCYPNKKWRKWGFVFLLLVTILPKWSLKTAVSFVDVGQGDSIVLQSFGNKEVYVIDTGGKIHFNKNSQVTSKNAEYTLVPFLKGEGIRTIDGLFLTHGDIDHVGDLSVLIQNFSIQTIYIGHGSLQHPNMVNLKKQVSRSTKIIELKAGDQVGKKIQFQVLHPSKLGKGTNGDSLVLSSQIKRLQFLFMGDLEEEGETQLLKSGFDLKADVLKLGHHGSKTSSTENFIKQVQPKHGIISCGVKNQFKHPNREVLETLEQQQVKVYRTDQEGMIRYEWAFLSRYPKVLTSKEG